MFLHNAVPQNNPIRIIVDCPAQGDPLCAWCLREKGQEMGEGSHGICKDHAEEQYSRFKASRAVRQWKD